ncbi:tyrosine-type recombinase/integrase [Sphingobium phenoxybenzoativorans]|uniref:tyrosine-type recombinase/integrase n=1 Tax=Sphingobium phenoxybenzoativorans TaxID=1592790 RepID=UPI001112EDC5|nr:site-specific integrase [Sphingobium phenoxybenzoativorans]
MLQRQAKTLSQAQIKAMLTYLSQTKHPVRNCLIFLFSLRAGLRAKEIAHITWAMVTDAEGEVSDCIRLTDIASKGRSGGVVPLAQDLKSALLQHRASVQTFNPADRIIRTTRTRQVSAQVIVNAFARWYRELGFLGCSSHSGRRTFITRAARNIGRFGGSIRDVQALARHQSLAMTQRYIEIDANAMRKVVDA